MPFIYFGAYGFDCLLQSWSLCSLLLLVESVQSMCRLLCRVQHLAQNKHACWTLYGSTLILEWHHRSEVLNGSYLRFVLRCSDSTSSIPMWFCSSQVISILFFHPNNTDIDVSLEDLKKMSVLSLSLSEIYVHKKTMYRSICFSLSMLMIGVCRESGQAACSRDVGRT